MGRSFLVLFLALGLISCEQQKDQKQDPNSGIQEIRGADLQTLTRICDSLETKREYHETLADRQIGYDIRTTKRDCGDTTEFDLGRFRATLRRVIGRDSYLESSSRTRYLKDIMTDRKGDLSTFCQQVFSGSVVENTITVGSSKFQLTLSNGPLYDNFSIAKARDNGRGSFIVYEIERASVITSRSRATQNYWGVIKERLIIRDCAVGADQTFRQIFNSY